jgi:hypothetical protein
MDYVNHYLYGTVAGCVGTMVSQPFFTLKTCLQNNELPNMKSRTYKQNFFWLYRGFTPAIIGYSIEKTLVFGTYNSTLSYCNLDRNNISHTGFAGAVSGMIASLSTTPFEQLTIDKQLPLDKQCLIKKYSPYHLYKGILPTMARESVGFCVYFSVYEYLSKKYNPEKVTYKTACIGTAAISSALVFFCPLDKIKTNIQSGKPVDIHNISTAYKGVHFALMRAIPFHVTCFIVFEFMQKINK